MSAVAEKKGGFVAPKPDTLGQKTDVMLGDIVYWYDGRPGEIEPAAAVVTRVGVGTSLSLSLIEQQNVRIRTKDGTKHHTDPTINEHDLMTCGTWDFHPRTKRLMQLIAELTPNAAQPPKK